MPIRFFSQSVSYKILKPNKVKAWILQTFEKEGVRKKIDLNIVFCTDNELLEINKSYLKHDFYTDIITFPIEEGDNFVEAEIYISLDRVQENANSLKVTFDNELLRVIIHGVLHLCGYKDATKKEKELIRAKESYYLSNV